MLESCTSENSHRRNLLHCQLQSVRPKRGSKMHANLNMIPPVICLSGSVMLPHEAVRSKQDGVGACEQRGSDERSSTGPWHRSPLSEFVVLDATPRPL